MEDGDNNRIPLESNDHNIGRDDILDNIVLNIGVTGESGAGKSSFVNAIRGLQDTDEGAAPISIIESSSSEPMMYPHPTMPNVNIWDLPGIGGINYNIKTYMKDATLQNCDLFIIVWSSKFKEINLTLAKEIAKSNKKLYFVRTQMDQDVTAAERRGQTEEQTLRKIQRDCEENLGELGPSPVFLISSHDLKQFDFQKLVNALERDLPGHKRDAVILYTRMALEKKYTTLKRLVWCIAFASGVIATGSVPVLSYAWDVVMIAGFLTKSFYSFGLDDKSRAKMSRRVNKQINEKAEESSLALTIVKETQILTKMAIQFAIVGLVRAELSPATVAVVSFITTSFVLSTGLNVLYKAAGKVIQKAGLEF